MKKISVIASPNIAFVKYWGKRNSKLKTPMNDNISMTLSNSILSTKTTIAMGKEIKEDVLYFGGEKREDKKMAEALELFRKRHGIKDKLLVITENNFPTAAGIASSASGFAALAFAFANLYGIKDEREISILARLGSGSACRSVIGGFVKWQRGLEENGEDSYAIQIASKEHWPELIDIIAVISKKEKKVSSRSGMRQTVETSVLYPTRVRYVNETRIKIVEEAIKNKDFPTLALEIMKDSNNMHATMLDTWPPIFYMNDISKEVVYAIHELNKNEIIAGYTFDAGPNAHIITERKNIEKVKEILMEIEGIQQILEVPVGDGPRIIETPKEHEEIIKKVVR